MTLIENKRSKISKKLKNAGIEVGTDMIITEEEKMNADSLLAAADKLNKEYIEVLKTTNCKMCTGWGHSITECTVFKAMEDFASTTPALYMAWGRYKGKEKSDAIEEAS